MKVADVNCVLKLCRTRIGGHNSGSRYLVTSPDVQVGWSLYYINLYMVEVCQFICVTLGELWDVAACGSIYTFKI